MDMFPFILSGYLGVELLGFIINVHFKVAILIYICTSNCEGISSSTYMLIFSTVILLHFSHSSGCDVIFQYDFNLHFPND